MNILGFDTSTKAASVALVVDEALVGEITINDKRTHSQKLMPMLENLLNLSNISLNDIDAISVCVGPGSFTGIRIAMSTVKAIAHVRDIPVVAVNSLENISYNVKDTNKKIVPILDAQGNNVYTMFDSESIDVIGIDELIEKISLIKKDVILVGEAVEKYKEKLVGEYIEIAAFDRNVSKASSTCMIGLDKLKKNMDVHSCYDVLPMYIRKSQAEIQYEEKQNKLNNKEG